MIRSWVEEKSFYPLILCIILILHGTFLFLRFQVADSPPPKAKNLPAPITLNIDESLRKQIVDSEDSANRKKSPDAYLSDKTRTFDRQTKARVTDTFKDTQRAKGAPSKKKGPKDLTFSDLGGNVGEDPFKVAAQDYTDQKNGDGGNAPTRSISSTNDHLEDIPLGDVTNLNTVEYKYYGFYHRIKLKLEQFWGRSIYAKAEQMAKQGRQLASDDEHITALRIVMDSKGRIVEINIVGSSGVKELDDAAVESFNEAGPFPNPPKDLVVNDRVTIEWGFVVSS